MSARELNPEVVELLAEVARATRTKLFDITAAQRRRQPFERVRISAAMAGLSSPERQLVSVHRAELARLLHEAFWIVFPQQSPAAQDIHVFGELPDPALWSTRAAWVVENLPARPTLGVGAALVAKCISPDGAVPAGDLLLASMRLVDTDDARNDLALDQIARGYLASALLTLGDQLSKRLSEDMRARTWLNIGYCHLTSGVLRDAQQAYLHATRYAYGRIPGLLSAFALTLRTGAVDDALWLARQLDDQLSPRHEIVEFFLNALRRARFTADEMHGAQSVLDRAGCRLGSVSGSIAQVFER